MMIKNLQPLAGKSMLIVLDDSDMFKTQAEALIEEAKTMLGELGCTSFMIITDINVPEFNPVRHPKIRDLGVHLIRIAEADGIILCRDWEKSEYCKAVEMIAVNYNMPIVYVD